MGLLNKKAAQVDTPAATQDDVEMVSFVGDDTQSPQQQQNAAIDTPDEAIDVGTSEPSDGDIRAAVALAIKELAPEATPAPTIEALTYKIWRQVVDDKKRRAAYIAEVAVASGNVDRAAIRAIDKSTKEVDAAISKMKMRLEDLKELAHTRNKAAKEQLLKDDRRLWYGLGWQG